MKKIDPSGRGRGAPVRRRAVVAAAGLVVLVLAVATGCADQPTGEETRATGSAPTTERSTPRTTHRTTSTTTTPPTTAPPTTVPPPPPPPPPPPTTAPPPPPPPAPSGGCHPSYSPCVPFASDVDCAGGSGNGPAYTGRVNVIGPDEYDLDRDGDGVGCE